MMQLARNCSVNGLPHHLASEKNNNCCFSDAESQKNPKEFRRQYNFTVLMIEFIFRNT